MFVVDYFDPIDMNGKYYGDFNITGEYQEDTGKIDLNWEDYGDGSGKEVEEYMIATRKNDGDFKMVARTSDLEYSLDIDSDTTDMDVRLVAIRKDGKYLSNILSYVWIRVFGISRYLAPLINLVVSIPVNFLMNKLWAFKGEKTEA